MIQKLDGRLHVRSTATFDERPHGPAITPCKTNFFMTPQSTPPFGKPTDGLKEVTKPHGMKVTIVNDATVKNMTNVTSFIRKFISCGKGVLSV